MRIYTFFGNVVDNSGYITDVKEIHHAKNVFRIKVGDKIQIIDGVKGYICSVLEIGKKEIVSNVIETIEDKYSLDREIDAYICITKGDAMSEMVRHLTEIGVTRLYPIISQHSMRHFNRERAIQISMEATKQCGAFKPMVIESEIQLEKISFAAYDIFFFAQERADQKNKGSEGAERLDKYVDKLKQKSKLAFIIGPEGGFSENETAFLQSHAKPISLGKRVLRSETASTVLAGFLSIFG